MLKLFTTDIFALIAFYLSGTFLYSIMYRLLRRLCVKTSLKYMVTILILVFINYSVLAEENTLRKSMSNLKVLPIEYGVNNFTLARPDNFESANVNIIITRSELPSIAAGDGDIYTIMYKQEGNKWNLVQYKNHKFNIITWPHTEEDAVSTIRFFVPKQTNSNNLEALYLLKAARGFKKSIVEAGIATFEIYKVSKNKDFGFMEFNKLETIKTKEKYCNIELALNKELGVAIPKDYTNYKICNTED